MKIKKDIENLLNDIVFGRTLQNDTIDEVERLTSLFNAFNDIKIIIEILNIPSIKKAEKYIYDTYADRFKRTGQENEIKLKEYLSLLSVIFKT